MECNMELVHKTVRAHRVARCKCSSTSTSAASSTQITYP